MRKKTTLKLVESGEVIVVKRTKWLKYDKTNLIIDAFALGVVCTRWLYGDHRGAIHLALLMIGLFVVMQFINLLEWRLDERDRIR